MPKDSGNIGFIGGGNMAEAIIKGLVAGGVEPSRLMVGEPSEDRRKFLVEKYRVTTTASNSDIASGCSIIILSVKPQVAGKVISSIANSVTADKLLVSIMAGIKTSEIESLSPSGTRVVRVMPNTPALVLEGASALCTGSSATEQDLVYARGIFDLVGKTFVVEEKLIDAVTGLSGSGPAYVFTFIEALSDAGVKCGLPRDVATGLAVQTVIGSAKLVLETNEHPAVLREKVTSPGGTTIAGIAALERKGFSGIVIDAVEAATIRAAELGKPQK